MTANPALLCFVSVFALASAAMAPTAFADTVPASTEASRQVVSYDQTFFKPFQVQTALDMVNRVPGFSIKEGDQVRGFAGAAGNVLIDGQRPTSKTDALGDILGRLSAGSIERIDLVIGGADGIDMQGQTKIVNVIRKASDKPVITFVANTRLLDNGWFRPVARVTYARNSGDKSLELSAMAFSNFDEGAVNGRNMVIPADGSPVRRTRVLSEAGGEGVELNGSGSHPLWGGKLTLNGKWVPNQYKGNYRYITDVTAVENLDYNEDMREGGLQYNRPLGKAFALKINALSRYSHEEVEDTYTNPDEDTLFSDDTVSKENILSAQITWTRSETLSFEAGLEKAYNSRDSDTGLSVNGAVIDLPASKVKVEEDRTEASLLATWRPRPTLTVESGLKYEWSTLSQHSERPDEKQFTYAKPRLQVTWSP
ncbi:MAG: TonB-dependent receptor, partial [Asticcacaulis sp.]